MYKNWEDEDIAFSGKTPMYVVKKTLRQLYEISDPKLKRSLMDKGYIHPNRRMRSLKHTKKFKNMIGVHWRTRKEIMSVDDIRLAISDLS